MNHYGCCECGHEWYGGKVDLCPQCTSAEVYDVDAE